ncbi:kinesin-domain-containing protein [Microstroma glucosiphilum]|uniref:Kinesin-domain-containing protein n=1 Tax=Pseudomicrostroma glucosiphilum TaxID=1684307 RepID=A0A316UDQ6_9BASI|nr:kinesin-domain-containing protein [Pseudomicrostroma glucosiphilum]PWN23302.1 kinesin-domain-containing protein [Pseudomicrostroma glucosiphilum]
MSAARPRLSMGHNGQGATSASSSLSLGGSTAQHQHQQSSQDGAGATAGANTTSVQVAVRVRPLNSHDEATIAPRWQRAVVVPTSSSSVQVEPSTGPPDALASTSGGIKRQAWTFDRVLGQEDGQEQVYAVAQPLITHFLDGYNATILAYGQTSSGKSFTMGTSTADVDFESLVAGQAIDPQIGIIPRAVAEIFNQVKQSQRKTGAISYSAKASFIEIYNEELIDLLGDSEGGARPLVQIREDKAGNILWSGLREAKVQGVTDVMNLLLQGSSIRRTNETDMNAQSSRSHAIFSLTLTQQRWVGTGPPPPPTAASSYLTGGRSTPSGRTTPTGRSTSSGIPRPVSMMPGGLRAQSPAVHSSGRASLGGRPTSSLNSRSTTPQPGTPTAGSADGSWQIVTSKFHFVDLAGSERLKRTNAAGDRAKEGISINAGLHALGNVISALGDPSKAKRTTHVPYRDSKLTRLLQDSLGGNAHTLMIACVAPTEYNVGETINTLQYANRARNIKNKVEQGAVEMGWDDISYLQMTVTRLRKELGILKGAKGSGDVASLKALENKEVMLWQGKYTEISQKLAQLTVELTKLQHRGSAEDDDKAFLAAAEPIIIEYERAIEDLENKCNLMKAALSHTEEVVYELENTVSQQEQRMLNVEQQLEARETTIVELQARLAKVQTRETATEEYARDLEARLQSFSGKDAGEAEASVELKKEMVKMKEGEVSRELYIKGLEERLAKADESVVTLTAQVERLEKDVERRDEAYKELQQRIEALNNDEQTKAIMEDFQRSEQSNLELRAEMDALKGEHDMVVKERGRLNDAAAAHELHRGTLEDKIRELEAAIAASTAGEARDASQAVPNGEPSLANENHEEIKVPSPSIESELEALRQQAQSSREGEKQAKDELEAINVKHQETLEQLQKLQLQISEAKISSFAPENQRPSSEAGFSEPREELLASVDSDFSPRPNLSRRGSMQYIPHRSNGEDSPSRADEQLTLNRRASSFFGYNPRQGGPDSPSGRERPRSLSQSLSQELSSATSSTAIASRSNSISTGSRAPRPLSLSGSSTISFSVPPSPTMTQQSPGGKQLEGRSPASYDRKNAMLEKGLMSLQEVLKKREAEIASLQAALKSRDAEGSNSASTPVVGLNIIGPTTEPVVDESEIARDLKPAEPNMNLLGAGGVSPTLTDYPQAFFTPALDRDAIEGPGQYFAGSSKESENGSLPSTAVRSTDTSRIDELLRAMAHQEELHRGKTDELAALLEAERQMSETLQKTAEVQSADLAAENERLKEQLAALAKNDKEADVTIVKEDQPSQSAPSQDRDSTMMAQEVQQLRQALADSQDELTQRERAFEEKLKAISDQASLQVEAPNAPAAIPVDGDLSDQEKEAEGAAAAAVARLTEEHQSALEGARAEHLAAMDSMKAEHQSALESAKAQGQAALEANGAEHQTNLHQMKAEHLAALATKRAEHQLVLDSLKTEHETALERTTAQHETALKSLKADHQTALETAKADHQSITDKLIGEHSEADASSRSAQGAALQQAQEAHEAALARILSEKDAAVADLRSLLDQQLTTLEEEHAQALSSQLAERDAAHQASLAELTNQMQAKVHEHEKALADLKSQHEEALAESKLQHEQAFAKHRVEAEAGIAATAAAVAKDLRSSTDSAATVDSEHRAALASLEAKANAERHRMLADVHNLHQTERQRMMEEHEAKLESLRQAHEQEVASLSRRLSGLYDVNGKFVDVDGLRNELMETGDALVILEDALTSVSAERDELVEELNRLRSEGGDNQAEEFKAEAAELRREMVTYRHNLTNLKTELQRSKNEVQAITEERTKLEQQLRDLQEDAAGGKSFLPRLSEEQDADVTLGDTTVSSPGPSTPVGTPAMVGRRSMPPPTPPPKVPPPPTPPTSGSGAGGTLPRSSIPLAARTSLSSLMTRAESPGPTTPTGTIGTSALTRSSSGGSRHTSMASINLNNLGSQEAKKLLTEQGEELRQLAKQLSHCEADLQANIDLVTTLEAALNDSERNLRKSRVQLGEVTRERDRYASQTEDLRTQLQASQKEVDSVRSSTLVEKQDYEQKIRAERMAKEKAARDLEARLEEVNRKKSSKLFCL